MIFLGKTARYVRESKGLTQRAAAQELGISYVHLSHIENNKAIPSPALVERFRTVWKVDLHVLAWCMFGDAKKLPLRLRKPMASLAAAWKKELEATS